MARNIGCRDADCPDDCACPARRHAGGAGPRRGALRHRPGRFQNAKLAQALALKMPDARVEVFDGIGHLVPLEAEERFNAAMLKFLSEGQ